MTDPRLVDHELVVHVFAPIEGPWAARALDQINRIWSACRDRLGLTRPILGVNLPAELPSDWRANPATRPLAAREDRGADYQAILRRDHDVLNLSMVFAASDDGSVSTLRRRLRVGSASPPKWIEFDRWWEDLATSGTDALLGVARLYQAKVSTKGDLARLAELAAAARLGLPPMEQDDRWAERSLTTTNGLALWEVSPRVDTRSERRLVLVAPADKDPQLSAFTWSRGDTAMPPLARYLMHAAKLRFQLRIWTAEQSGVEQARQRMADRVAQLSTGVERTVAESGAAAASTRADLDSVRRQLHADVATATVTLARLQEMRRTVEIAADNMTRSLEGQLRQLGTVDLIADDQKVASWFIEQIDDAAKYFEITYRSARDFPGVVPDPGRNATRHSTLFDRPPTPERVASTVRSGSPPRTSVRMGFAIDVVGYSPRSDPAKADVQRRVTDIVGETLRDMGLELEDTDHQGTGDGINIFLPERVEIHRGLPRVVHGILQHLAHDNGRHRDRLRLRLAAAVGPMGLAALGFSGNTVVECGRLVESEPIRQAMVAYPDRDLAVLISDTLHKFVVAEGKPGLSPADFRAVDVIVKDFQGRAWLWVPPAGQPAQ